MASLFLRRVRKSETKAPWEGEVAEEGKGEKKIVSRPWGSSVAYLKRWSVGRLKFTYERRMANGFMGRFGGGWNWELGFVAGGRTVILNLLVSSLRIEWERKKA